MKTRFGIALSLSLGLLSANAALANDAVLGAILGGGLGAVVGNHVGGRDGAIVGGAVGAAAGVVITTNNDRHHTPTYVRTAPAPVRVYTPAPVYAPAPVYVSAPVYYATPVRVVRPPVVYVPVHPSKKDWRHDRYHRHDRRDGRWR